MKTGNAEGFALIDLLFVCGIIGILAGVALPGMLKAKQSASSASAIGSMRSINSAQLTFALTCASGFYAPNLTTLGYPPTGSREAFLGGGLTASDPITKSGYAYTVEGTAFASAPASCNGLGAGEATQGFIAIADSTEPTNSRFFAINASGSLYEHSASLYSVMPEIGPPPVGHAVR